MRALCIAVLAAATVLAALGRVEPHTAGSTGYASITLDGRHVRYSLTLWPAALPPAIVAHLRGAREGQAASRAYLVAVVRDKVALVGDGRRCEPGPTSVVPASAPAESVTVVVELTCGDAVGELTIRDDLFDVLGADYHTVARIDGGDYRGQFAFTPETRETRVRLGGGHGTVTFVRLGVEHILSGWDHLLFLLGLLLPGGGLLAVMKIVTAFTLAHSVTLSLAVLNVVVLPERAVEAVIALSIAAVAAENIFLRPSVRRRWIVSFAFGLVHGVGFSSALREIGLPSDGLVLALFGFNVGVELGQALVVSVALPALLLLRRQGWEARMVRLSSTAILLVGLLLFVERAFL
jgi:hypothetical protein